MNEILKIVLSLSLSGALLVLVLLLCKPLFRDRISKRWQYYIWLVVIARLLLPFTPETSPVGTLFQQVDHVIEQTDTTPGQNIAPAPQPGADTAIKNDIAPKNGATDAAPTPQRLFTILIQNLWLVWLVVALILIIRKVTIYQGFVKYINAGRMEVSDTAILDRLALVGEKAGVKRPVELYTNSLISSPLLLGFFRPCIVLPSTDLTPIDLENTLLHELTHYKHRDMFYKWLVQLVICLHWFNPFVYLMGREVGRACELACDEAVIMALDPQGRRTYGDTLLNAMGAGGSYKDSLASVTLNESKELLKERLDAIMRFKKKSKAMISATLILTLAICCGATYVGAYAAQVTTPDKPSIADITPQADGENGQSASLPTPTIIPSRDYVKVSFTGVSVTGQGPVGVELARTQNSNVTFELLNMDNEESCTTKAEIVDGTMQITVNNDAPNGINVNFGPDYQNVVRVLIPDAIYTKFEIQSKEMVVQMQDFNAPVHVNSNRAGFWLIDDIVSQGTYDIDVTSGPIYIEADTILKDITANADSGPITMCFNKTPTNLYLDSTNCGPVVERPNDWPAVYKVGNETPKIILSNTGKAVIEVKNSDQ